MSVQREKCRKLNVKYQYVRFYVRWNPSPPSLYRKEAILIQRLPFFKAILFFFCIIFSPILWADSQWGTSAGFAGSTFGMDNAGQSKGGRLSLDDHFLSKYWYNFELFLQGSSAYYHSDYAPLKESYSDNLWIFALAPVIRYHFTAEGSIDPFIDLSSGPGYLSTIHYENRNLGIHFTVQNMMGIGAAFGQEHQWTAEMQIFHYSNAGISDHNRGFTSPVFMSMSYQF